MNARPPISLTQAGYARAIRFAATSTGHRPADVLSGRTSEAVKARHTLWAAMCDLGISGAAIARASRMDASTINSAMKKPLKVDPAWAAGVRNAVAPRAEIDCTEATLDDLYDTLTAALEAVQRLRNGVHA